MGDGEELSEEAKKYRIDTDFAFFVVNFHMSRADFESLTRKEKVLIMKAYEDKIVAESSLINEAVKNALANYKRKKNSRPIPFWKKHKTNYDVEELRWTFEQIKKDDDRSWYQKILQANKGVK